MKKAYIAMKKLNNFYLSVAVIILFPCLFSCVNNTNNGFKLQKFTVLNANLQIIIDSLDRKIEEKKQKDYELVLELNKHDSLPEFWFIYGTKGAINHHIFSTNRRIVGYLENKNIDVLLLSNINDKMRFESFFYSFVKPSDKTKEFNYIVFPSWQYAVDENGRGLPYPSVDYQYLFYIFENKKIEQVVSDSLINDRLSE